MRVIGEGESKDVLARRSGLMRVFEPCLKERRDGISNSRRFGYVTPLGEVGFLSAWSPRALLRKTRPLFYLKVATQCLASAPT